jgi:DNA modification methylase
MKDQTRVDALKLDPHNPRQRTARGRDLIVASLKDYGAARSIVVDERDVVLAGNGVVDAATEAGITKVRIVEARGDEIIAVRRRGLSAKQKRALAIADNRTGELAEWNAEALQLAKAGGLDLRTFWTAAELNGLLPVTTTGLTDPDAAPRFRATTIRRGDRFTLGRHRLLCGDSTVAEDVGQVLGRARAVLMNTDPPYGVDYAAVKNGIPRSGFRDIQARGGDITNDDLTDGAVLQAFLERMIRAAVPHLSKAPAFYLWHPMLTQGTFFAAAAAAADVLIHRQIIWVKPHMVLTRSGQYHWKHELCFYGWIRGKPCPWFGGKGQVSVWEVGAAETDGERVHPTRKPVELFRRPIANHCRPGDTIYEPFAGSGSQLIAAEQTGVVCAAIELEPRYCQVTIDRWEAFTGKKARNVASAPARRRRAS